MVLSRTVDNSVEPLGWHCFPVLLHVLHVLLVALLALWYCQCNGIVGHNYRPVTAGRVSAFALNTA